MSYRPALRFPLTVLCAGIAFATFSPAPIRSAEPMKLLFTSKQSGDLELYVANADGTDPKNLTNHPSNDVCGAWSPDGKQITFFSDRGGTDDLYVMNADGSQVRQLTSGPGRETAPTWSADGKKIAFVQGGTPLETAEICVVSATGGDPINLTNNNVFDGDLAWSPDGKQILFASTRDGQGRDFSLYLMNTDGTNPHAVPGRKDPRKGLTFPDWFPDGKRIVFADHSEDALELFAGDLDGENRKQLTKMKGYNIYPSCSPDGKQIAFYHWDDDTKPGSLWVVDSEGNAQSQLVEEIGPFFIGRPDWKPQ